MSKNSYTLEILQRLLNGETLASADFFVSNCNQYFCEIKNNGVELLEVRVPNKTNKGTHKERTLLKNEENISRAKELLLKFKKVA